MAIYHLSAKVISRAGGRSSVAAAAYRSGSVLLNERDGQLHDYSRKGAVEHAEILAPDNAPDWMRDRAQLWNAVEVAEKRRDAQLAREIEVSLPRELGRDEQRELIRSFAQEQFVDRGMIADIAIHNPKAVDGQDQPHAHVMLTMRTLTGEGFGNKNRDWNGKDQLGEWREAWEAHANRALEWHGHEARIDHRTLDRQREAAQERGDHSRAETLDREPQPKLGIAAAGMERRGRASDRGEGCRAVRERNAERASIREQLREISTRINEAMRKIGGHVHEAADRLRERLNQAAAIVLARRWAGERVRSGEPESGSTAGRDAKRLREEALEQTVRTREKWEPRQDLQDVHERLSRAAASVLRRSAEGQEASSEKTLADRIKGRLRAAETEQATRRQEGGSGLSGARDGQGQDGAAKDQIAARLLEQFYEQADKADKVREREQTREQKIDRTRGKDRGDER